MVMRLLKIMYYVIYSKLRGFVSQIFVIILMLTMSYTAIMSESIRASLNAFVLLKENIESFENEARYIHELKCYLIGGGDIDEYEEVRHFDGQGYCGG